MPNSINRIFSIKVNNETITFYSRGKGERGRDIGIVRQALGGVYQIDSNNSPALTIYG